jgi:pyruvate-ferredoxin/flavodoxin oxidoreductase
MDFALIAQAPRWKRACPSCTSSTASAPRTRSAKIEKLLTDDDIRAMIDDELVRAPTAPGRSRPTRPVMRGTAQNPDVYFQAANGQSLLPATPASCRRRWTSSPA